MIFADARIDIKNLQFVVFVFLALWVLTGEAVFLTGFPLAFALLGYSIGTLIRDSRMNGKTLNPIRWFIDFIWNWFFHIHLVTLVTLVWIMIQVQDLKDSWISVGFSMSVGTGNWAQIARPENFFSLDSQTSPFIHLWIASAIAQVALIFILIGFAVSLMKFQISTILSRIVVGIVLLVSIFLLVSFLTEFVFIPEYFLSTWTWIWAAIFGLAFAFLNIRLPESRGIAITSDITFLAVIGLLIFGIFNVSFIASHYFYLVLGLIVIPVLSSLNETLTYRVLSSQSVSAIARLSFGAFLWSWPCAQFIKRVFGIEVLNTLYVVGILLVSFALSYLSTAVVNRLQNILNKLKGLRQWSSKVAVLAILPVLLFILLNPSTDEVVPNPTPTIQFIPALSEVETDVPDYVNDPNCTKGSTTCVYGNEKSNTHIVLFGSELAGNWQPALAQIAADKDWKLEVRVNPDCPSSEPSEACEKLLQQTLNYLLRVKPDVTITNFNIVGEQRPGSGAQPQSSETLNSDLVIFEKLIKAEIKVVLLRGASLAPDNPVQCLRSASDYLQECLFSRSGAYLTSNELERRLIFMTTGVEIIDATDEFCVQDICFIASPDKEVIYRTSTLITKTFSLSLASLLAPQLQDILDSPISTRPFNCKVGDRRPVCQESEPSTQSSN